MVSKMSDTRLPRTSPEEQGVLPSILLDFITALDKSEQEIHSFMLLRHGSVIAEGWWTPHAPNIPHTLFSLSKSFASTAVGIAVDEGYLSVEDPVLSFFPNTVSQSGNSYIHDMQVKHLLTMSTGHEDKPFPFMYTRADQNWAKGFFETPIVYAPGTHFLYNTGATYMLSEIIQRTTNMNLIDFLTPRLFEPLAIENATWLASPTGVSLGGIGLSLTTEDIACFGQLYLQKGEWDGQRILSEAWIESATSAQVSNGDAPDSDWTQGYGYQFWRCQHGFYRADGAFGQFCIVMEEYDAVLAMTSAASDMQTVMNIVWDTLLPAFQTSPLPDNQEMYARLEEKSNSLSLEPISGETVSPIASNVSGKTYHSETNEMGFQSVRLDFIDSACTLNIGTERGDTQITASYGQWEAGHTSIFDEIWLTGQQAYVASGAWRSVDTFVVLVRLYETPYVYTLTFHFNDDRLTFKMEINVSLEANEARIIHAKLL